MEPPQSRALARPVAAAAFERQPACGRSRVVAIDGPSGSGKTSFAAQLAQLTGATTLHLEDLYRGWQGLEPTPDVVAAMLGSIAVDDVARAPSWDWEHDTTGPDIVMLPVPLILVEGVGAGARSIAPFTSLLVWLDAPEDERRTRALARDGDVYEPWWDVWADQERKHFRREGTRGRADFVVG